MSAVGESTAGVDSSVDSSSDQPGSRTAYGGVSSSSSRESRREVSVVEFTHVSEEGSVTSSAVIILENSVFENDMVDSSMLDKFAITVEAELENVSAIGQDLVDNAVSSKRCGSFPVVRQSGGLSSTSSHEEIGTEVHNEDDNSDSDSITNTTPSETFASPAD